MRAFRILAILLAVSQCAFAAGPTAAPAASPTPDAQPLQQCREQLGALSDYAKMLQQQRDEYELRLMMLSKQPAASGARK
jgi:hypothetical protein